MAQQELAQSKYHGAPTTPPSPSTPAASPSPSPTPAHAAVHHIPSGLTTLLVIVLIVVLGIALLLILRKIGKPRRGKDKDEKSGRQTAQGAKDPQRPSAPSAIRLTGAALHRHNAEQAAHDRDWQEAIRERFRAVIGVLDERGLMPERRDRTADEAARDAGRLLPEHAEALSRAALAFDEVEYGEYAGTPEGYAVIRAVDEAVSVRDTRAVGR